MGNPIINGENATPSYLSSRVYGTHKVLFYQKKILLKLRGAMLRWGRRAPDRTLRFGAERTASGGVLVEAWVIMLTGRHGLSARLRAMVRGVGLGVPRQ